MNRRHTVSCTHYEALLRKTHWKHRAKKQEKEIRTDEEWQRLFIPEKIKGIFHHWPYELFWLGCQIHCRKSEGRKKKWGNEV